MRDPARRMTGSSVRKRQQPPSLERLEIMLRRWQGSVNGSSIGLGRQVVGIGSRQTILLARRTRTIRMCSFDARTRGSPRLPLRNNEELGSCAQWKINQPPSLRDNEQSWREPILFMVRDGFTHIGMDQADLEKADCSKCLIARRGPIECGQRKNVAPGWRPISPSRQ